VVPGDGTEVWEKIYMNREEKRGGKEIDGCPLQ
jgi:hypothetical protein